MSFRSAERRVVPPDEEPGAGGPRKPRSGASGAVGRGAWGHRARRGRPFRPVTGEPLPVPASADLTFDEARVRERVGANSPTLQARSLAVTHRSTCLPATIPLLHAHWKLNAGQSARPLVANEHYLLRSANYRQTTSTDSDR
jgi:hypothetical protein